MVGRKHNEMAARWSLIKVLDDRLLWLDFLYLLLHLIKLADIILFLVVLYRRILKLLIIGFLFDRLLVANLVVSVNHRRHIK